MQLATVALLVLSAAAVRAEDECAPKPGAKPGVHADECCKMGFEVPDSFREVWKTCREKIPKPSGPPPAPGTTPDATMYNVPACMMECMFTEAKMLTGDKKLDKDAITKFFTAAVAAEMKEVVTAAIDKCVAVEVDPSLECKSGAAEFRHCFGREAFLNCPSTLWTSSGDCDGHKTQLTKCPMMPVILIRPKGPAPK